MFYKNIPLALERFAFGKTRALHARQRLVMFTQPGADARCAPPFLIVAVIYPTFTEPGAYALRLRLPGCAAPLYVCLGTPGKPYARCASGYFAASGGRARRAKGSGQSNTRPARGSKLTLLSKRLSFRLNGRRISSVNFCGRTRERL